MRYGSVLFHRLLSGVILMIPLISSAQTVSPEPGRLPASPTFAAVAAPQQQVLRLYLVRHGQTESNVRHLTVGGGGNADLTAQGRHDALCLGRGLAQVPFIAAYSSSLGRAVETTRLVLNGRALAVTTIDDLKDISWGDAEGGSIDALTERFGHSGDDFLFYFGRYDDPAFVSPVHAENMAAFSARFERGLQQIVREHQGEQGNILVTAHSSIAFYLQKFRGQLPLSGLSNTSVSILELKGGVFHLTDFNDTGYLSAGCPATAQPQPAAVQADKHA